MLPKKRLSILRGIVTILLVKTINPTADGNWSFVLILRMQIFVLPHLTMHVLTLLVRMP